MQHCGSTLFVLILYSLEPKRLPHYSKNDKGNVPSSTPSPESHTGAIVYGTVGVVVALVLALLGWFLWRRRRAREERKAIGGDGSNSPKVTPFMMAEATSGRTTRLTSKHLAKSLSSRGRTRGLSQRRPEATSDSPGPSVPINSFPGEISTGRDGQALIPRIHVEIGELRRDLQQMLMSRYDPPPEY